MDFQVKSSFSQDRITIDSHLPMIGEDQIIRKIVEGLSDSPKRISSMFFYDSVGSSLFEDITDLNEYYPTRIEKGLIKRAVYDICPGLQNVNIVELGSGDCSKISLLLNGIPDEKINTIKYTPVDVSQQAVKDSALKLRNYFPGLIIHGIVADFTSQLHLIPENENTLFCFFGSTLGNFSRRESETFFRNIYRNMNSGDKFLLGVDMVKERIVLERAYNDKKNVTATFNKNILNVVNNLVDTNFNLDRFDHLAFFNREKSRIEMHLVATEDMIINSSQIPDSIRIRKGEKIHTENSYKFTYSQIKKQAENAGLSLLKTYSDDKGWFSLLVMFKD